MTCCPTRNSGHAATDVSGIPADAETDAPPRVTLRGGKVAMGTTDRILPQDGERPLRHKRVKPFAMDSTTVTNARFARFVAETGYVSEAHEFGWSYVFHLFLPPEEGYQRMVGAEWWCRVDGATWDAPEGPGSDIAGRMDHPVTHVSWHDAQAFARWAGGRLPSEAEWEHAAQGGLGPVRYPWGDRDPDDRDHLPCNIWQGRFPDLNTAADGHAGTAPGQSFAPNRAGLYNMVGNVWEWTGDPWRVRTLSRAAKSAALGPGAYVLKGGSYLCHVSYCFRYRIAARIPNTPDSATGHTGFRLVYNL